MVQDPAVADLPVRQGELLLGKYQIGATLGAGGMGVVVAAEHLQLGQKVAVKFLSAALREKREAVERFLREARAAARIRSEHVVRVVDVSGADGDLCYMVMEYLDGEDLSQVIHRRGHLPVSDAVGYVVQACEAIGEAHGLGIVHRDLKPGNLFLTHRPDGSPLIKVLDFGISKAAITELTGVGAGVGGARAADLTSTSMVLGSPMYMSPEQLRSAKNVDARTDVWSLGVILHELLTGLPAFNGESTMEVLAMIVADPPTPLRQVRPELPAALEQVVLACLEKLPAARLQSVSELVQRLAPFAPTWAAASVGRIVGSSARLAAGATPPPIKAADADVVARAGETQRLPEMSTTSAQMSGELVAAATTERVSGAGEVSRTPRRRGLIVAAAAAAVAVCGVGALLLHNQAREPPSPPPPEIAARPRPVEPVVKPPERPPAGQQLPVTKPPVMPPPQIGSGPHASEPAKIEASVTAAHSKPEHPGGRKTRPNGSQATASPATATAPAPASLTHPQAAALAPAPESDVLNGRR